MSQDVDIFLMGSGARSAKFENVGDKVSGTICETPEMRAQTDIATGKPLTWDDGAPKMQLVITLQTTERDPADPEDDGKRRVYVKGSKKPGSKSMHDAVAGAIRAGGAKGLQIGGVLEVAHTGSRPADVKGFNPAKQYEARYTPPSASFFNDAPASPTMQAATPPF